MTGAGQWDGSPPISDALPVRVEPTDWLDGDLPTTAVFEQSVRVENGGFDEFLGDSEFDVTTESMNFPRSRYLNRSCELTDIRLIYRGYVTRVNL